MRVFLKNKILTEVRVHLKKLKGVHNKLVILEVETSLSLKAETWRRKTEFVKLPEEKHGHCNRIILKKKNKAMKGVDYMNFGRFHSVPIFYELLQEKEISEEQFNYWSFHSNL